MTTDPTSGAGTDGFVAPTLDEVTERLAMPMVEAMRTQRAVRRLHTDPVPLDILMPLLELSLKAPTSSNTQDWSYLVLEDREQKARLGRLYRILYRTFSPIERRSARGDEQRLRQMRPGQWQAEHFEEIPLFVIPCYRRNIKHRPVGRPQISVSSYYGSVYPPVQNLLLACRAAGLGASLQTLPIWCVPAARHILDLPRQVNPVCVIPIGWAKGKYGPTTRRPIGEVVHIDRFGNQPFMTPRVAPGVTAVAGILDGIRVVDLSWGLAGPVATLLLAEAGAEVVKVEPPTGDPFRDLAPAGFATWNRSKRSVVLDSWDALDALLTEADVLVHGLRPSVARRHGLDDDSLAARHPHLIVSSLTGYPIDGSDAERAGWDALVQARLGLMDEQAGHRAGPVLLRFPIPSWGAGYLCAAGILARLIAAGRGTAGPGPAHTSLVQGALVTLTMHWARAETPTPSLAGGLPKDMSPSLYECSDGVWIHVMGIVHQLPPVLDVIASLDPAAVEAARAAPAASYYPDHNALVLAFAARPSAEWCEALWALDIPVLPAQRLGEILGDEQARINGYVIDVDDPALGPVTMAGPPLHVDPPLAVRSPAPTLGADGTVSTSGGWAGPRRSSRAAMPPSSSDADSRSDAGEPSPRAPLAGWRVLDCGNFLAGPFASMLLADLGADVIKLETTTGDPMRPVERVFAGCQRGKRSIALNLKEPGSRPVLEALLRNVDVVHHNLRLPAATKLGLDEAAVRAVNPDVIFCHTSAYGPRGPRADWPGFDQLFQAYSGWEAEGGGEGNPPMWHRMGMMDHQAALASLVAMLLAIYRRDTTGEPSSAFASILGASCFTGSEVVQLTDGSLTPFAALDADQAGLGPGYRIDGPRARVAIPGFEGGEETVVTNGGDAFLGDPANIANRLAVAYDHPVWGRLEQVGALWNFGDLDLALDRPPPTLDQHGAEIRAELGLE